VLRSFGATEAQLAEFSDSQKTEGFELWPENFEAMRVFMAMATQWRVGMSGVIGLDYCALPVVEKRLGLTPNKTIFSGLQILEKAVLDLIKNGK
jgi:hypothetical protein